MSSVTVTNTTSPVKKVLQNAIDNRIIRIMRNNEITFVAKGLLPDTNVQVFLDDTRVNRFVQQANKLTATSMSVPFYQDEEIINAATNAYAKVITTSNNFIYINQNFINLNVKQYGAGTLTSTSFADKDVIFQTDTNTRTGVITFVGTIERYTFHSSTTGAIAINPIKGGFRADPENVLFIRTSASPIANVSSLMRGTDGDLFPASSTIRGLANAAKTATVSSREHYSGIITYYSGSGNVVHVSSNVVPISPVGKEFRIASGGSTGQVRTIVSSTANGIILTLSGSNLPLLSSNSKYTIGDPTAPGSVGIGEVDDYGIYCGIFHIPEYADAYFATGKRLFTVTDGFSPKDNQYKMRAFNFYGVDGRSSAFYNDEEYSRNALLTSSPSNPIASSAADALGNNKKFNPLSQTFFTPRTATTTVNGVANSLTGLQITGVDVFFAKKPTNADLQLPVTLSIVPVVNDLPSPSIVIGKSIVEAKDVKTSIIPDAANSSTVTTFKFVPPVIVNPGTEYALALTSSSPDYSVFVAEIGGNILGTTPARRVSQQPYIGDFYKAQNASLWTPIPNEDLMFRVRYGSYPTSNTIHFVPENVISNTNVDAFILKTVDYNFKPTAVNYSFKSTKVDGTADAGFTAFRKDTTYDFGADLITSTKTSNRRRKLVAGNRNSFNVKVDLTTTDSYV